MTPYQHQQAWNKIHATPVPSRSFVQEWYDLRDNWLAKRNAPYTLAIGKRHAKGKGKGVGCIYKTSRVIPQVGIERVFKNR